MANTPGTSISPRRRPPLDQEAILEAAIRLAAERERITFRGLGTALGVDHTTIYRHFRDRNQLIRAVQDRLIHSAVRQVDRSASWREQLVELSELTWKVAETHPALGIEALQMTTGGSGELDVIELILVLLEEAGLSRPDAVRFYAVYSNYVLTAAASAAANELRRHAVEAPASSDWLGELAPVDPTKHPAVHAAREGLASLTDYTVFTAGVDVILDAAEQAARRE